MQRGGQFTQKNTVKIFADKFCYWKSDSALHPVINLKDPFQNVASNLVNNRHL